MSTCDLESGWPWRSANKRRGLWTLALPLVWLVGCGEGVSTSSVVEVDSSGVLIVETSRPTWLARDGWQVEHEPQVVIGLTEGSPEYQFTRVLTVLMMPDRGILVADDPSLEVRVFDVSGSHIRSIGGSGDGPGEFRAINGVFLQGDTIVVIDGMTRRMTKFDTAGAVLETTPIEASGEFAQGLWMYRAAGTTEAGMVFVADSYPADMTGVPTVHWDSMPTLLYGASGDLLDTIAEYAGMDTYSTSERAGPLIFGRRTSAAVAGGRLYMADGSSYEVREYLPRRGLVRRLRVLREPRQVTATMVDEYIKNRLIRTDPARVPQTRERLDAAPKAGALPWISAIVVDVLGSVWVKEYPTLPVGTPTSWGVFGGEGDWLGNVAIPSSVEPYYIGTDFVLGVRTDTLGVESVVLHRLYRDTDM